MSAETLVDVNKVEKGVCVDGLPMLSVKGLHQGVVVSCHEYQGLVDQGMVSVCIDCPNSVAGIEDTAEHKLAEITAHHDSLDTMVAYIPRSALPGVLEQ